MITGDFPVERFKEIPTPFYFYDMDLLESTISTLKKHLDANPRFRVHYAVKANFNPRILEFISKSGLGADCVSGGEVKAAYEAGFKPESIVYAGVGKRDDEIEYALGIGISRFNVESKAELEVIDEIACRMGKKASISLRVNPDVGAHTHVNIVTGKEENKFGINWEQLPNVLRLAIELPQIEFKGLHFHIGSQILDMGDFEALCDKINQINTMLRNEGLPSGDINVGGGLGIDYEDPNGYPIADFGKYFNVFKNRLEGDCTVHFELGRSIIAQSGSLINRVLYVKEGTTKNFAIIDGSMTELIRPALYQARHRIENITSKDSEAEYDVVGPVCESSDVFGKAIKLNECHRGDFIAIRSAGAYGESMASCYNCRHLPQSLLYKK